MSFKILIPARLGSKGLKNKNLKKIKKKSLVEIAIINAIKSKIVKKNDIFLSSDSEKILNIGKKFNISLLKRPKKFSNDNSTAADVINHFKLSIDFKKKISLIYLQPSSPLESSVHLIKAKSLYSKNKNKTTISGYIEDNEKFFKAFLYRNNKAKPLINKKFINKNRQSIKHKIFIPNGAIYIFELKKSFKKINVKEINTFIMNRNDTTDINTYKDYLNACRQFKK